jgi:purine-binding chemotaxis protein CheW
MAVNIAPNTNQLMHILVQGIHICLPIQYIVKVLPLVELKYIPKSADYCTGLMNLNGRSILVIDLAIRLHLKRTEKYHLATPIILCHEESREVGIIVDEIIGLIHVEDKNLQMQDQFTNKESPFKGTVTIDSKLALLLNMQKLLSIHLTGFTYE